MATINDVPDTPEGIHSKELLAELNDYRRLFESGALKPFGTDYVIVHGGKVVAHGPNSIELVFEYRSKNPDAHCYVGRADGAVKEVEISTPEFESECGRLTESL